MRHLKRIMTLTGFLTLSLMLFSLKTYSEPFLNGLAVHSELGKEQFIAGLFTNIQSNDAKAILLDSGEKRIQVRVVNRRISSRSFRRMWIEGMAINAGPKELAAQSQNMATFSNMLKAKLIEGDIFTIDRSLDDVTISLNGTTLGRINDIKFFDLLLRTWIGPVPLSSDFRESLLAQGKLDKELSSRFNATRPSDARIAAVETLAIGAAPASAAATIPGAADIATPKIDIAPPDINTATVASAPKPKEVKSDKTEKAEPVVAKVEPPKPSAPKKEIKPTPKPEPKNTVALVPPAEELLDESLFDDDDDEVEFTAASVLAQTLYISKLKRWTNQNIKSYPSRALQRGWEGTVRMAITINREGKLQNVTITEKAPYKDLDKAALKAVKHSDPYPAMPKELKGKEFQFTLPIVFVLR